jgi:hypothetical protein
MPNGALASIHSRPNPSSASSPQTSAAAETPKNTPAATPAGSQAIGVTTRAAGNGYGNRLSNGYGPVGCMTTYGSSPASTARAARHGYVKSLATNSGIRCVTIHRPRPHSTPTISANTMRSAPVTDGPRTARSARHGRWARAPERRGRALRRELGREAATSGRWAPRCELAGRRWEDAPTCTIGTTRNRCKRPPRSLRAVLDYETRVWPRCPTRFTVAGPDSSSFVQPSPPRLLRPPMLRLSYRLLFLCC